MSDTPALPVRYANGRFGPGNPGRRAGARNRMSHRAAMAILEDFETHKDALLGSLRTYNRLAYFTLLMGFVERDLRTAAQAEDDLDPEDRDHRINGD